MRGRGKRDKGRGEGKDKKTGGEGMGKEGREGNGPAPPPNILA